MKSALASTIVVGLAANEMVQPGPSNGPGLGSSDFGWGRGPRFGSCDSGRHMAGSDAGSAVEANFAHAAGGNAWANARGTAHVPILTENEIVGNHGRKADFANVKFVSCAAGPFGEQIELAKCGGAVGLPWVNLNFATPDRRDQRRPTGHQQCRSNA